jgi:hypothetical protein
MRVAYSQVKRLNLFHKNYHFGTLDVPTDTQTELYVKDSKQIIIDASIKEGLSEYDFYVKYLTIQSTINKLSNEGLVLTKSNIEYLAKIMELPLDKNLTFNSSNNKSEDIVQSLGKTAQALYNGLTVLKKLGVLVLNDDNEYELTKELQILRKIIKKQLSKNNGATYDLVINFVVK